MNALLCMPRDLVLQVRGTRTPQRATFVQPSGSGLPGQVRVLPRYANVHVGVGFVAFNPTISDANLTPGSVTRVSTTLGELVREQNPGGPGWIPGGYVPLGTVTVPVAVRPDRYPLDWYATQGSFGVGLIYNSPPPVGFRIVTHGTPSVVTKALPCRVQVLADPDLSPLTLEASASPCTFPGGELSLQLHRPGETQLFVLVVALIPFVVEVLLGLALLRRRAPRANGIGAEVFVGVTAVLLAILPIRLVLVPTDITGLTLVDYILGTEMAVLAAFAFLIVQGRLSRNPSASTGPG
jgi:hypothetical protein